MTTQYQIANTRIEELTKKLEGETANHNQLKQQVAQLVSKYREIQGTYHQQEQITTTPKNETGIEDPSSISLPIDVSPPTKENKNVVVRPLSLWHPFDYLRLLWLIIEDPSSISLPIDVSPPTKENKNLIVRLLSLWIPFDYLRLLWLIIEDPSSISLPIDVSPPIKENKNVVVRPLSLWNPFDYLRLLWLILVQPKTFKAYREKLDDTGEMRLKQQASWLASTMTWLPLAIGVAADFEIESLTSYILLGFICLAWLLTGFLENQGENEQGCLAFIITGVVVFVVAGNVVGSLANGMTLIIVSAVLEIMLVGAASGMLNGVTNNKHLGATSIRIVALVAAFVVASIVTFGAMISVESTLLVVVGMIAGGIAASLVAGAIVLVVEAIVSGRIETP